MAEQDAFERAQAELKGAAQVGTDDLLRLYGLFKQATAGDVTGKRPGMLDLKGRAKFDAWAARRGLSTAQAQAEYVALVKRLLG